MNTGVFPVQGACQRLRREGLTASPLTAALKMMAGVQGIEPCPVVLEATTGPAGYSRLQVIGLPDLMYLCQALF